MKNKDLGTVEFLIFLIKHFFSSIFHYLLSFAPIFGNCIFLILGKKTPLLLTCSALFLKPSPKALYQQHKPL